MNKIEARHQAIIGTRFGKWTVLDKIGSNGNVVLFKVRCDCGYEADLALSPLKRGASTQCKKCSDIQKAITRIPDLTGKRFGVWIALHKEEDLTGKNRALWLCRCDCGAEKIHETHVLMKTKHNLSGCSSCCRAPSDPYDIVGKIFGKLLVVGPSEKIKSTYGGYYNKCYCECGFEDHFNRYKLIMQKVRMCVKCRNRIIAREFAKIEFELDSCPDDEGVLNV